MPVDVPAVVGLKICGVTGPADAALCRAQGVAAIGLNFWPGSPRYVERGQATAIAQAAAEGPLVVGVFVDAPPAAVAATAARVGLDAIQPHGDADPATYAAIGLPWVWVIRTPVAPTSLVVPEPPPCWVLVDAPTPNFGGQGLRADWGWAAEVVRALSPLPVWLAGGIRPGNATQAIAAVDPAGLDVASGAEVPGSMPRRKDAVAVAALVSACTGAKR